MSIRAKLVNRIFWMSGIKKLYYLPEEQFEAKARALNSRRGFRMPKDHKAFYRDETVRGCHVLIAQRREACAPRAILFLFGGGMILDSDAADRGLVAKLASATGADVWFPYYPLCLDHSIRETYEMVFECYRKMVGLYGAGNVSTCGFSSGGALAIGVALHNNALGRPLAMPRHIVAVSPGECPWNEEEHERMKALDPKDPEVAYAFMARVEKYMRHGEEDIPPYMISGSRGDFRGIPDIHFYYSTDEVLYGAKDCFEEACRSGGVPCHFDAAPGMIHCYCMLPFTPEGTAKFKEIVEILKQ